MIEINLVPDVKQELIRAQATRTLVISVAIVTGIVAVTVVIILAATVFGAQTLLMSQAQSAIETNYNKLKADHPDLDKVLTIQNQLNQLGALNENKLLTSRLFDVLVAISPAAPNAVIYSDIGLDSEQSTITIQGQAANSYGALDVFKKTIARTNVTYGPQNDSTTVPLTTEVSVTDTSYGQDSTGARVLRFILSFSYPPELFSTQSTNLKIVQAEKGNVTDSYTNLPAALFGDRASDIEGDQ